MNQYDDHEKNGWQRPLRSFLQIPPHRTMSPSTNGQQRRNRTRLQPAADCFVNARIEFSETTCIHAGLVVRKVKTKRRADYGQCEKSRVKNRRESPPGSRHRWMMNSTASQRNAVHRSDFPDANQVLAYETRNSKLVSTASFVKCNERQHVHEVLRSSDFDHSLTSTSNQALGHRVR